MNELLKLLDVELMEDERVIAAYNELLGRSPDEFEMQVPIYQAAFEMRDACAAKGWKDDWGAELWALIGKPTEFADMAYTTKEDWIIAAVKCYEQKGASDDAPRG